MPALQDLEDSLEDEYDTVVEPSQTVYSTLLDNYTKPYNSSNRAPLLTPAIIVSSNLASPNLDTRSSITLSRSPILDFQPSTRVLRKQKRRDLVDLNAAQNRELINSNLRELYILLEGAK